MQLLKVNTGLIALLLCCTCFHEHREHGYGCPDSGMTRSFSKENPKNKVK